MNRKRPAGDENRPPENEPQEIVPPGSGNRDAREPAPRTGPERADAVTATGEVSCRGPGSTIEFQPQPVALTRGLAALRYRDFRLFWLSQLISLVGTWMQIIAQGWLVLELGGSAFELGVIGALQFLPMLGLSLFGGLLADQLPKRRLLLETQSASMILAFVLALFTGMGIVRIAHVMVLAALLGLVNAIDMPTRQAFVVELVGRQELPNAVALNSAAFNAARLAGPAIGGLLIAWTGLATVFFLNGVSFLPVIAALVAIRAGSVAAAGGMIPGEILTNVREGLSYVRHSPLTLLTVSLVALVATFGMNFNVVAPILARDVLDVGADGFGILMSALGLGALVASMLLAFLEWEPHPKLLIGGAASFGLLEIALSRTAEFALAVILLGAIGFAMILLTTVANTTLQTSTPDYLRGRVLSVYTTCFVGTTPLGSLFTGALAQAGGIALPLLVGGAISAGSALLGWWRAAKL